MEQIIDKNNTKISCKEYKKYNTSFTLWSIVYIVTIYLIYQSEQNSIQEYEDLKSSFINKQELVCFNQIVSLKKGYKFMKDKTNITNGDKVYSLHMCRKRDK